MKPETLLNPGTQVPIYGKIGAILWTGGERYYLMIKGNSDVSLMPASLIEKLVAGENNPKQR